MAVPLTAAARLAALAIGPEIINQLLSEGLPKEMMPSGKIVDAVSPAKIEDQIKKLQERGKAKGKEKDVGKILGRLYGGRQSVAKRRPPKPPGLGRRLLRGLPVAANTALAAAFLLPMFGVGMGGGGGEGGDGGGGMGMGEPGMGGEEGDILGLLGALQQQAQGSAAETRSEFARTQAGVNMLDRRDMAQASPSALGMGRASALEELIRGQEDALARMSYNEPMSLAQAYAMQGLYRPMEQSRVNFRDLI